MAVNCKGHGFEVFDRVWVRARINFYLRLAHQSGMHTCDHASWSFRFFFLTSFYGYCLALLSIWFELCSSRYFVFITFGLGLNGSFAHLWLLQQSCVFMPRPVKVKASSGQPLGGGLL